MSKQRKRDRDDRRARKAIRARKFYRYAIRDRYAPAVTVTA